MFNSPDLTSACTASNGSCSWWIQLKHTYSEINNVLAFNTHTGMDIQMILVNCIPSMQEHFMKLTNICNYQCFTFHEFDGHIQ